MHTLLGTIAIWIIRNISWKRRKFRITKRFLAWWNLIRLTLMVLTGATGQPHMTPGASGMDMTWQPTLLAVCPPTYCQIPVIYNFMLFLLSTINNLFQWFPICLKCNGGTINFHHWFQNVNNCQHWNPNAPLMYIGVLVKHNNATICQMWGFVYYIKEAGAVVQR